MRNFLSVIRYHAIPMILFGILTIAMTWPLMRQITTGFPSYETLFGGDPNMYIWYTDWIVKAISGTLPTTPGMMLYFPQGIDPLAGYDGVLMLLITVPVRILTGNAILAYNTFLLTALFSSAFATYALVYHLTNSRWASFIGGFAFGFSPYMMLRLAQHPNLIMLSVLPLLILATLRFVKDPTKKTGVLLATAIFLTGLSSAYYLAGGLIFLVIALTLMYRPLIAKPKITAFTLLLLSVAVLLPVLPLLLSETHGGIPASDEFVKDFGAQPVNFILPHPATNVFGGITRMIDERFPLPFWEDVQIWEGTNYLGIMLIIALVALFNARMRKKIPYASLWYWTAGVFTILSMGLETHLLGMRIPLPFSLLWSQFPFSLIRVPNRFFVFALLATVIIATVTFHRLFEKIKRPLLFNTVVALTFILLLAERAIFPLPIFAHTVPTFYTDIADDAEQYAIAELPITFPGISAYNYLQMTHAKPLVNGEFFYPAYSPRTIAFISNNALLAGSICDDMPAPIEPARRESVLQQLRDNDIKYVVIHDLIIRDYPFCENIRMFLHDFFEEMDIYFTDGTIIVYKLY